MLATTTQSPNDPLQVQVPSSVTWTPDPNHWVGETVLVVGGGFSLKGFDWDRISNGNVIGINNAYALGDWISFVLAGDPDWMNWHWNNLYRVRVPIIAVTPTDPEHPNVQWLGRAQHRMSYMRHQLGWFDNTGMSGICLAARLGAARILLLGFDMKLGTDGESNWHPNYVNEPDQNSYPRFMDVGLKLKQQLDERYPWIEVINCNPDSEMDLFPRMKLRTALS